MKNETIKKPSFLRQSARFSPSDFKDPVHIIGCGAVGSHAALCLAKVGWRKFYLYDDDIVEDYNVSNQAFFARHIGMSKTEAVRDVLLEFDPTLEIHIVDRFFDVDKDSGIEGVVFSAVDSMSARKEIFSVVNGNYLIPVFAEIRLGFNFGESSVLNPLDSEQMQSWYNGLCDGSKIKESPCNEKICATLVWSKTAEAVHQIIEFYACEKTGEDWKNQTKLITNFTNEVRYLSL